jgi:hypothetical protein
LSKAELARVTSIHLLKSQQDQIAVSDKESEGGKWSDKQHSDDKHSKDKQKERQVSGDRHSEDRHSNYR